MELNAGSVATCGVFGELFIYNIKMQACLYKTWIFFLRAYSQRNATHEVKIASGNCVEQCIGHPAYGSRMRYKHSDGKRKGERREREIRVSRAADDADVRNHKENKNQLAPSLYIVVHVKCKECGRACR